MTVRTRPHRRSRTRPRIGRRVTDRTATITSDARELEARERDAGGPQDLAAYSCSCGYVFDAPVSTTVGCPHCGGTQAW